MRDVLADLLEGWRAGETAGLATVVATFRSAPRGPGASMLVGSDGEVVGSVSGGCVESSVYELALLVTEGAAPTLQRYGVSDDDAFDVGLTCGGILDVFVERVDQASYPELGEVAADVEAGRAVAVATIVEHPESGRVGGRMIVRPSTGPGPTRLESAMSEAAAGLLAQGQSRCLSFGPDGERQGSEVRVFMESFVPAPRMLVFGAIDFAAAVTEMGRFLGYRVTVCDARPVFTTPQRFPAADEVVVAQPHRYLSGEASAGRLDSRTAVCVLTHDPKFDIPLLKVALKLPDIGFVGAMGSRRTHDRRVEALLQEGLTPEQLSKLSSPIGLDLGARTPEETAVSVAGELIAFKWGGTGNRLSSLSGPLHRTTHT